MRRRMKGASGTAGDTGDGRVAVNVRVRVYPGKTARSGALWSRISAIWPGMQWISVRTI